MAEDRRFYLVASSGRIIDRLTAGTLVRIAAATNPGGTALSLRFPDGELVEGDVRLGPGIRTSIYGADTQGREVLGPWADALSTFLGREVRLVRTEAPGATRSGGHASLVGDGSLSALARQLGLPAIDGRRFRMLLDVEGCVPHEEDTWVGTNVSIGAATVRISGPLPRCAITTQDPDTGQRDLDVIRAIIAYRGLRDRKHADFGVLGEVVEPGMVRVGDPVRPAPG